jgi:hypothetical protein
VKLELRAMTRHGSRAIAVVISSTMPSAKYSCSGSPLKLAKGSTAIEGFSAAVETLFDASPEDSTAGVETSVTSPMKRMPLRVKVRIICCEAPSSPIARRTALIRVVSADSDTIRPPHTACSRSSLLTTRSRF